MGLLCASLLPPNSSNTVPTGAVKDRLLRRGNVLLERKERKSISQKRMKGLEKRMKRCSVWQETGQAKGMMLDEEKKGTVEEW